MFVTTKKTSNLFDFVDYQNVGQIMNFLCVFTHARDRCFVTSEYVTHKCLWRKKQCIQLASLSNKRVCSLMFKCAWTVQYYDGHTSY